MTRHECEKALIGLMEQAGEIYRQYKPDGKSLLAIWHDNGFISVSDLDTDPDTEEIVNWEINVHRYSNGDVRHVHYEGMTCEEEES